MGEPATKEILSLEELEASAGVRAAAVLEYAESPTALVARTPKKTSSELKKSGRRWVVQLKYESTPTNITPQRQPSA